MKKLSMKSFKQFEISKEQTVNTKGGIFCEIYVGHLVESGETMNNGQMQKGMNLDAILVTEGMASALQKGGQNYINKYS